MARRGTDEQVGGEVAAGLARDVAGARDREAGQVAGTLADEDDARVVGVVACPTVCRSIVAVPPGIAAPEMT